MERRSEHREFALVSDDIVAELCETLFHYCSGVSATNDTDTSEGSVNGVNTKGW